MAGAAGAPAADITDRDRVRHRLWVVPADQATDDPTDRARELIARASARPITIADRHHRYETALRYRDERRMTRSCESDPAFDYVLMLFLETTAEPLTVLPTHRVVRGLGGAGVASLQSRLGELFTVRSADRDELRRTFA